MSSPFGDRLRKAREARDWRLDEAAVFIRQILQGEGPSRETIRRYELGLVDESDIPAIVLAGMANAYEVSLESLSPLAAKRLKSQLETLHFAPKANRKPSSGGRTNIARKLVA